MTINQREQFYLPAFHRAARINNWRMKNCRLIAQRADNEQRSSLHALVWELAQRIADYECRAIIPEDFRYAVNAHVNEGKTSSKVMRDSWRVNWEVATFDLLADPENIKAMICYQSPKLAIVPATIAYMLKIADESAWEQLSLNGLQTRDWKHRPLQQLVWLLKAKKNPDLLKKKPSEEDGNRLMKPRFKTEEVASDNIPF